MSELLIFAAGVAIALIVAGVALVLGAAEESDRCCSACPRWQDSDAVEVTAE